MKGYIQLLMGFIVMVIFFAMVFGYLYVRKDKEIFTSDAVAEPYKIIDAIEFTKLNIKQDIAFSIEKTKQDLGLTTVDANKQKSFLDRFKSNFHPSQEFSDVDVSISVNSIDLTNSKLTVDATIVSSSEFEKAESKVQFMNTVE